MTLSKTVAATTVEIPPSLREWMVQTWPPTVALDNSPPKVSSVKACLEVPRRPANPVWLSFPGVVLNSTKLNKPALHTCSDRGSFSTAGQLTGENQSDPIFIPPALRQLALKQKMQFETVERLVRIPKRGKEPHTPEEWGELYQAVRPYLE